jgi:excisionase family DNA binding protein
MLLFMITKNQILAVGAAALTKAFHSWLDENREPLLHLIAQLHVTSPQEKPTNDARIAGHKRPYLTTTELARRWNCCVHTVRRKVRAGELPGLKMSRRRILIPLEAVLKFEKGATSSPP